MFTARVSSIQASTYAKAERLGAEMAADPAIKPILKDVTQHTDYFRFRNAHRALWEQSSRFELYYQERIFALADRESKRYRYADSDAIMGWDLWYTKVVHPIKTVVWQTWETTYNLEARYLETLLNSGLATPADIQRMLDQSDGIAEDRSHYAEPVMAENAGSKFAQFFGWGRRSAG